MKCVRCGRESDRVGEDEFCEECLNDLPKGAEVSS